jgi:hypothetical protein
MNPEMLQHYIDPEAIPAQETNEAQKNTSHEEAGELGNQIDPVLLEMASDRNFIYDSLMRLMSRVASDQSTDPSKIESRNKFIQSITNVAKENNLLGENKEFYEQYINNIINFLTQVELVLVKSNLADEELANETYWHDKIKRDCFEKIVQENITVEEAIAYAQQLYNEGPYTDVQYEGDGDSTSYYPEATSGSTTGDSGSTMAHWEKAARSTTETKYSAPKLYR